MFVMFFKGMLIALVFGIPAGAIGVLCVQRTIEKGFWQGLFTGLGSSLADVIYASAGIFGLSFISLILEKHDFTIRLCGSILIFALGLFTLIKSIRKKSPVQKDFSKSIKLAGVENAKSFLACFASSLSIALLNPATFLSFLIIFSSFQVTASSISEGAFFVAGIFLGTALWWLVISALASLLKKKMNEKFFNALNITCGILMILFSALCWVRK